MKTTLFLFSALLFHLIFAAEQAKPIHLVFDVSGSMWGRVPDPDGGEARMKIAVAREALNALLQDWDPKQPLGLTVYGHRRAGDCADIETLFSTGEVDVAALRRRVSTLKPKGKTPLAAAVRRAAQDLAFEKQAGTIILLSDGIETCAEEPCQLVKELAAKGIDLKLHVIGFDVDTAAADQLHCLADATDGMYFAAENAADLKDALTQVVAFEQPQPEPEKISAATVSAPAEVPAGAPFEAAWTGPANPGDRLQIQAVDAAVRSRAFDTAYIEQGNPSKLRAPDQPGSYQVRYVTARSRKILAEAVVQVVPTQAEVDLPAEVVAGAIVDVAWKGPGHSGEKLAVYPSGWNGENKTWLTMNYAYRNPVKMRVPVEPGAYEMHYLTARTKESLGFAAFTVVKAEVTLTAEPRFDAGADVFVRFEGGGQGGDRIHWFGPLGEAGKRGDSLYVNPDKPDVKMRGPVEPGRYEFQYLNHKKEVLARLPFDVVPSVVALTFPEQASVGAHLNITWQGPAGSGDRIQILEGPEPRPEVWYSAYINPDKEVVRVDVPSRPGEYRVVYRHGRAKTVLAESVLRVKDVTVTLKVPATVKAGERMVLSWEGSHNANDRIFIMDGQGKRVRSAYAQSRKEMAVKAPDAPGDYEVQFLVGVKHRRVVTTVPLKVQ
ncbi:vWA domain-containing protein [Acanthopleuribacter pedis]|uniref:VWA domain-containing protein n=1 Tax=Acanthopleuribacter pedis TaxID=442870 RepID=A0A8J7QPI8_9BACT|nr:VWA domain-containing protein [Acanthopleuribacter pedis]MBO1322760.1 VWA domain-containing protein [Acanthopleuribacter pedis]